MRRITEDTLSLLAGAGVGVALMYLLDPDSGERRRRHIARGARDAFDAASEAVARSTRGAISGLSSVADTGTSGLESARSTWRNLSDAASDRTSNAGDTLARYAGSLGALGSALKSRAEDWLPYPGRRRGGDWLSWRANHGSMQVARTAGFTAGGLCLVALGAGVAYLFDPDRGRGRRAYLRDKAIGIANDVGNLTSKMGRHAANHLRGTAAEVRGKFRREHVDDETLAERVRSQIGRAAPGGTPRADVCVTGGHVVLRGSLPHDQMRAVARAARQVRGVRSVDCQITPTSSPGESSQQSQSGSSSSAAYAPAQPSGST
jgi:hypothetical protein